MYYIPLFCLRRLCSEAEGRGEKIHSFCIRVTFFLFGNVVFILCCVWGFFISPFAGGLISRVVRRALGKEGTWDQRGCLVYIVCMSFCCCLALSAYIFLVRLRFLRGVGLVLFFVFFHVSEVEASAIQWHGLWERDVDGDTLRSVL